MSFFLANLCFSSFRAVFIYINKYAFPRIFFDFYAFLPRSALSRIIPFRFRFRFLPAASSAEAAPLSAVRMTDLFFFPAPRSHHISPRLGHSFPRAVRAILFPSAFRSRLFPFTARRAISPVPAFRRDAEKAKNRAAHMRNAVSGR